MIKVVDKFTDQRPYREFFIGLIGSTIVTCVLFVISVYALMFIGYTRTNTGLDLTKHWDIFHAILRFWSEISLQLALLVAAVIGSVFQFYVSRRTIDVLPRSWLYATVAAVVLGLIVNFPAMHSYALSAKGWPVLASADRSNMLGGLPFSTMPLTITFFLIAVAQGLSLAQRGIVNATLWSVGSLVALGVLMNIHRVPAYPLVQALFAAALCYRYWRQKDPRKSHDDAFEPLSSPLGTKRSA